MFIIQLKEEMKKRLSLDRCHLWTSLTLRLVYHAAQDILNILNSLSYRLMWKVPSQINIANIIFVHSLHANNPMHIRCVESYTSYGSYIILHTVCINSWFNHHCSILAEIESNPTWSSRVLFFLYIVLCSQVSTFWSSFVLNV